MAEEHEIEGEIYDDLVYSDLKFPKEGDEVEEGEIYDDSHIDIDAKIQTVLGDYIKDFEGAVSAENLGPNLVFMVRLCRLINLIRIKFRSSDNTAAALKSSDLHTGSDKTHCPELTTSGNESPVAPFIIQGEWIRCSTCRKWRLLPYGTKPDQLSQSWVCTMLDWLPGMNFCDISEDDTTSALHALYQSLIQSNFQNRGAKGTSIDVKEHNGREVSVKKRKSREQDYLGNDLGESDANAVDRKLRKQKKSKGNREGDRGIKDSAPIEREQQVNKYGVKHQSEEECGMMRKPVYKKAIGYGKEEDEVEGGEIYDDSHIDIDAKIQTVLGDYIKDFEGAVSAENLGPKFGVYGSFLASHQLFRSSGNTAPLKSSDLHTDSDKANCPELTTSGDEPPVAPFIIQGDLIRCSKGLVDLKAHNGREISVKKRKSREQDYLGNELGESDANAFESKFRKQKKSKVIQTEKMKSSRSKGEGKSTRRDRGIKDSAPIEREQQAN
ncbi:hypothetical protein H5410_042307 [Solanum commersonii]|uniref:CW-type domain-containing protein n=1 Tax=Solanum commersonii TaxID=4109 RepID=A0A9J5XUD2_SOLCO|nr:hypothetical protein H5410_042307 [Solanum commersonii]